MKCVLTTISPQSTLSGSTTQTLKASKSMGKAFGLRINRAADDAAGLSIPKNEERNRRVNQRLRTPGQHFDSDCRGRSERSFDMLVRMKEPSPVSQNPPTIRGHRKHRLSWSSFRIQSANTTQKMKTTARALSAPQPLTARKFSTLVSPGFGRLL